MGYTHYWNASPFTDDQWNEVIERGQAILSCSDIPLQLDFDEPLPVELSNKRIRFNGVEDDGHETFYVTPDAIGFAFCKTAYKPYDEVVVAFLIMLNEVNPEFTWDSDGEDADHEAGRKLYERSKVDASV